MSLVIKLYLLVAVAVVVLLLLFQPLEQMDLLPVYL